MMRIRSTGFLWSAILLVGLAGAARATPNPNGATLETRTFNDCPISTLSTTNNYPSSISITDVMDGGCVGFANLHSWSFSEDGGTTSAVFNNPANFRFGASIKISGTGGGEGGLRLSPWFGKFVDGRIMCNVTTGEIACFGGRLPFYSFTAQNGITYTRGTTIRIEVTYLARDLYSTDQSTIQYRAIYNNVTYDSPALTFDEGNTSECDPHGLWGILNDARVGGYFQPSASGSALTATWSNITFDVLPEVGTPVANGAIVTTRTFNDCPISTLATTNSYPALISISDTMDPGCVGFANLHSWSFSEDGGTTAAPFNDNSNFHYSADFKIDGAGEGEGGLRISPWFGQFVDGRFMCNATTGEIACFGGRLPFYSFTGNHGITYTRGTNIRLDVAYQSNDLIDTDPATIKYKVTYNGNTYSSPALPFDKGTSAECGPYLLWGMLNDGRVGGYFQPRANTGAQLAASWGNIRYSTCPDPVEVGFKFMPHTFQAHKHGGFVTASITPKAPYDASDIDVSSVRLNGLPVTAVSHPRVVRGDCDGDGDDDHHWGWGHGHGHGHGHDNGHGHGNGHHNCPKTLIVKFSRSDFASTVTPGDAVPVVVSGTIGAECFEATTTIRVRSNHCGPHDNDVVAPNSITQLQWDPADAEGASTVALVYSTDGGETWSIDRESIANSGSYTWRAPSSTTTMRLAVAVLDEIDEDGAIEDAEIAETGTFTVGTAPTGVGDGVALSLALQGVTPNPAQRSFIVSFSLPNAAPATVGIYDISGRQIVQRAVGGLGKGTHRVTFGERESLPPGIYLVRLNQGALAYTTRVAVIQ